MDQAVVGMAPEVGRRRRWSLEEKQAIVALSLEPGCTVGEVAACFGVAPAQIYGWRRELREGRADAEVPMFLPAAVEDSPADILSAPEVTGALLPDHAVAATGRLGRAGAGGAGQISQAHVADAAAAMVVHQQHMPNAIAMLFQSNPARLWGRNNKGLVDSKNLAFDTDMAPVSDDRARWLAQHVLPHEPALRAWLQRRPALRLDIDDIVQEAYTRLASLPSVAHIDCPRSYFFRTAQSLVQQQARRAKVVAIDTLAELDQLTVKSDDPSPEHRPAARQELRLVAAAIAGLPDKCRQAFLMRKVDGLSQREIANRLGVSESTVEKHIGRGIRMLMDVFGRGGKAGASASRESESVAKIERHAEPRDKQRD